MRPNGYGFILGRKEGESDFKDVRVRSTPEGFNYVEIARDPRNLDPRTYIVDRRSMPQGAWNRVLRVDSFTTEVDPENASETTVDVEFEDFRNIWGIKPERTFGIPAGMESPWFEALEMVGNELLLPEGANWVSGDAPTNVFRGNIFSNGKYTVSIDSTGFEVHLNTGRRLARITTAVGDLALARSIEGTAGVISLEGGVIFMEPAKPPMFIGNYALAEQPELLFPGLYQTSDCYMICTHLIEDGRGGGALSILSDPYPDRWIPRCMCRAFARLSSPSNVPPFVEDEPERISVEVVYPDTDWLEIEPDVVTPYANKTGVFNSWEAEGDEVQYLPTDRPWDVLLRFDSNADDYGGHAVQGDYRVANDRFGDPRAAFPAYEGYEIQNLREMREGTLFLRFKDSAEFLVLKNSDMEIYYKRGYLYFTSYVNPNASGIGRIEIPANGGWVPIKVDWTSYSLTINDKPGMTDEQTWGDTMIREEDGSTRSWGDIMGTDPVEWTRNPDIPEIIEQYQELPPTWVTGLPEGQGTPVDYGYWKSPRTWGRVLYEGFGDPRPLLVSSELPITEIGHLRLEELL